MKYGVGFGIWQKTIMKTMQSADSAMQRCEIKVNEIR